MGTIIDKLNHCKSVLETLYAQLNTTAYSTQEVYDLKDIETQMSRIHLLRDKASVRSSDVRLGETYYKENGILYVGNWDPYSGATAISANDLAIGKRAYDNTGTVISGKHVCNNEDGISSENPYTLNVYNNTSNVRIVKSFSGNNNNLSCVFCEPGESYTIKVDLGSIIPFIFVDNMPRTVTPQSPLYRIAPSCNGSQCAVNDITNNGLTNSYVAEIFPDLKDKNVYAAIYGFYFGVDNTSIKFS